MGTDAQTEEEDRKGPVRQGHKSGRAAEQLRGVPAACPGAPFRPSLLLAPSCLSSPVPITIQKYRPKPKFCQAGYLKPSVPIKSHHPLPQTAAWGWAGAIFSLGSELILTHQQET